MFYVGQRVVCVDDEVNKKYFIPGLKVNKFDLDGLRKGEFYTIRGLISVRGMLCVLVEEIRRNFCNPIDMEIPFAAGRFRPIVKRDTDISIFKKMLKPEKVNF